MTSFRLTFRKVVLIVFILSLQIPSISKAEKYLTTSEFATIGFGSAGMAVLGQLSLKIDTFRTPLIKGPLPLEKRLQYFLGGECTIDKTNFLDNTIGSVYTPVGGGLIMFVADLTWPQGDKNKTTSQDLYLYSTGLFATKGLTGLIKGIVARERPIKYLEPEMAAQRKNIDFSSDYHSFFSGHTSSSFYAVTFVNKRLRSMMRSRMSGSTYKSWRWLPPTILYSWASFVGWSRINVWKHYISDVLVGATVGYLMAELYYSFGEDIFADQKGQANTTVFKITISF